MNVKQTLPATRPRNCRVCDTFSQSEAYNVNNRGVTQNRIPRESQILIMKCVSSVCQE